MAEHKVSKGLILVQCKCKVLFNFSNHIFHLIMAATAIDNGAQGVGIQGNETGNVLAELHRTHDYTDADNVRHRWAHKYGIT